MSVIRDSPLESARIQTMHQTRANRAMVWLFTPIDIASLVYFRIVFGGFMLWLVYKYCSQGWVELYFIDPPFHLTYYGFEWVKPWPGEGMHWHFYAMGAAAVGILLGFCYRLCATIYCLGFTYVFLLEKSLYQNHYYMVCLVSFLMIFLPAHRAFSIDTLIKPQARTNHVPLWTTGLITAQLGIVYFYGGIAKINHDWLLAEPILSWLPEQAHFWEAVSVILELPLIGGLFESTFGTERVIQQERLAWFIAYAGLFFDLAVVPLLLWKRTRVVTYLFAVLPFHLANSYIFHIGIFPWFMICATLMFFSPSWPRRLLRRILSLLGMRRYPKNSSDPIPAALSKRQKWTAGLVAAYMTFQLLIPFRHHLYPGNVSWTEEGHHFSWHMMLRRKLVGLRFYAADPQTGKTGAVPTREHLTERQMRRMGNDPDMILTFAHYLADYLHQQGHEDVEIYALALASLNGRKPQLLFDTDVDLASIERTWKHQTWVNRLTEPLLQEPWRVPLLQWEKKLQIETPVDRYLQRLSHQKEQDLSIPDKPADRSKTTGKAVETLDDDRSVP